MKISSFFLVSCILLATASTAPAQTVGFGNAAPQPSAALDINAAGKGVLIPRMTPAGITAVPNPAKGLIIYDSVDHQLLINTGTASTPSWKALAFTGGWGLHGNSGTNPATNFIGNTDGRPLRLAIHNIPSGLIDSTSGSSLLGYRSVNDAGAGYGNTGIGFRTLDSNTLGSNNAVMGDSSMMSNDQGSSNTFLGFQAMTNARANKGNTGAGFGVLYNTSETYNTTFGTGAMGNNPNGGENTVAGALAMNNASALGSGANSNNAIGYSALLNTTGSYNVAVGAEAMRNDHSSTYNTAIGSNALYNNYSNASTVAIGSNAAYGSAHDYVTATGAHALEKGSNAGQIASGYMAGGDLKGSTAIGYGSMQTGVGQGTNNTALGTLTLVNNTDGYENAALGGYSGYYNTTGHDNTGLGFNTNYHNSIASGNTAAGVNALYFTTLGANTGIGGLALMNTTASMYNTVVGYNSGSRYDMGYNNTMIGANCDISTPGLYNCVAIGQEVTCTDVSQVRIGNAATNSIGGYANFTAFSDGRFKKDIVENVAGLDFVAELRPVTYNLDISGLHAHYGKNLKRTVSTAMARAIDEKEKIRYTGFVAQEVESAAKKTGYAFSGIGQPGTENDTYSLRYEEFVPPLIKALQQQHLQLEDLRKENAGLLAQQQEEEKLYQQILSKVKALEMASHAPKK